jgi:hypothetical protein
MRKWRAVALVAAVLPAEAGADRLDVVGTVLCRAAPRSDVLVVFPTASLPSQNSSSRAGRTEAMLTGESGYYRLEGDTSFVDRWIRLEFWTSQKDMNRRDYFVARERTPRESGIRVYRVSPPIDLIVDCDAVRGPASRPTALPSEGEASAGAWGTGTGGTLSGFALLAQIGAFAAAAGPERVETTERLPVQQVTPSDEGKLLRRYRTVLHLDPGFRYAASRNLGDAFTTNPAPLALEPGAGLVTMTAPRFRPPTDVSAAAWDSGEGWGAGAAYVLELDRHKRVVTYGGGLTQTDDSWIIEQALLPALAHRLSDDVAVSVGGKILVQSVQEPYPVRTHVFEQGVEVQTFDSTEASFHSRVAGDVSFGVVWDALPTVRIGAAVQDLLGTPVSNAGVRRSDRTAGVGILLMRGPLHLGVDLEHSQVAGLDASVGATVKLSNAVELGGGFLTPDTTVRVTARLAGFLLSLRLSHWDDLAFALGGSWVL